MIAGMGIDWTNVLVALIAGLPAIIAAIFAARVNHKVKTPSGKAIGAQVEDALHTALSNNFHLQSIGTAVNAQSSPEGNGEAAKVQALADRSATPDATGA